MVLREQIVSTSAWQYTDADQSTDGLVGLYDVEVAQISAIYGPGLPERLTVAV